jgi:hypothetical protein
MKDSHYILIFAALGLVLAFAVSKPLRRPSELAPIVGTPMNMPAGRPMTHSYDKTPAETHSYADGTISLGSGVTAEQAAQRTLFIIARAAVNGKPAGGPPIAVQKINSPAFPFTFSLTNANNMMGTDFYEGDLALTVRLDVDGMAGPKQPEDIETVAQVKAKGPRQVRLTLSKTN